MLDGRYRGESGAVRVLADEFVAGWVDFRFDSVVEGEWAVPERDFQAGSMALEQLAGAQEALHAAEAKRIVRLLAAYRAVMGDVGRQHGAEKAGRGGTAARSFLLEAAQVLNIGEWAVAHLLDTAIEAETGMPACWAVFTAGGCSWRAIDLVVQQAGGLDDRFLPDYDRNAAEAIVTTAGPKVKHRLHVIRERLQTGTAVERRRAAEATRHTEIAPLPDGLASLTLIGPAELIIGIDDAVTKAAVAAHGVDGEERCVSALKFDIAVDLLLEGAKDAAAADRDNLRVPQRKGVVPTVFVTVPILTALGHTTEPATLAGYGPIDIETARQLTAQAPSITRILTDPVTGVRVAMDRDTYKVPPDMKRWLQVRDGTCRAPGCRRLAHQCDVDHVVPWTPIPWTPAEPWIPGGNTNLDNLAHLCRVHHQVKGDGYWHVELDSLGRQIWVSAFGGKRYVTEPADQPEPVQWVNDQPPF